MRNTDKYGVFVDNWRIDIFLNKKLIDLLHLFPYNNWVNIRKLMGVTP